MKSKLLSSLICGVVVLFFVVAPVSATFVVDTSPSGTKFFIDSAHTGAGTNFFTGGVGGHSPGFPTVDVSTVGNVTTGAGFANIKPVHGGTLTSLTFTPADPTLFDDFAFRGQLLAPGDITVTVVDNGGSSFTFTFSVAKANKDFKAFGVISHDGETIKSVTLTNAGFKEEKQNLFSFAGAAPPVPEPSSLLLLGTGVLSLGGMVRRKLQG